jgi:hypothetical protein
MFAKQIRIRPLHLPTAWSVVLLLLILPALYVELTGDFPGRVWFYGQEEDSELAGVFLNAHNYIFTTLATTWDVVGRLAGSVKEFFA